MAETATFCRYPEPCCICRIGQVCIGHPKDCCRHCPGDDEAVWPDREPTPEEITYFRAGGIPKLMGRGNG